VWANMYSDPFSSTTPAAAGIDNPGCVKWRETLPSQEESAGSDIPMGQLVTKVLVSRKLSLPPCQHCPFRNSPDMSFFFPKQDMSIFLIKIGTGTQTKKTTQNYLNTKLDFKVENRT